MNSGAYMKTFFRGSAISLAGTGLLGILNYLIRRKLSIDLSITDYGTFYSTCALLAMIFGISDVGLTQSGTLMIAAAKNRRSCDAVFSQLFMLKGTLALLCACGVGLFANFFGGTKFRTPCLLPLTALFVCQALGGTLQALWNGRKNYALQQFYNLFIAGVIFSMLWAPGGPVLRRIALCFLFPTAIALTAGLLYSRTAGIGAVRLRINRKLCGALFVTGGVMAVSGASLTMMYYLDTVMLNALRGPDSAGLYNVAIPIMQIAQSMMVFPAVFTPIAVEMTHKKEYSKLLSFVIGAIVVAAAAALPVWMVFNLSGSLLIRLLFDAKYAAAAPALAILCTGMVFFTLGNLLLQVMFCLKKVAAAALITGFAALLNIMLNYLFIRRFGICGAAAATLASYTAFSMITGIALIRILSKKTRTTSC